MKNYNINEKIFVLYGGMSVERPVSLRSGKAVVNALIKAGFDVQAIDVKRLSDVDVIPSGSIVLPILHGKYGEDGVIQDILETARYKYLGSDSSSSKNSFDKIVTKDRLRKAGIPVAEGDTVTQETYSNHKLARRPHIIKVARGGSSIGTHIAHDPQKIDRKAIDELFRLDDLVLIEELIKGVEITVPILGGKALPVIEIVPPESEEFNYKNKYNGQTKEICPAVSVTPEIQKKCQQLAMQTHQIMNCRHLSRVDMMIDKHSSPKVLEINTMPGLADVSLYPVASKAAGYSMPDLMREFVKMVTDER